MAYTGWPNSSGAFLRRNLPCKNVLSNFCSAHYLAVLFILFQMNAKFRLSHAFWRSFENYKKNLFFCRYGQFGQKITLTTIQKGYHFAAFFTLFHLASLNGVVRKRFRGVFAIYSCTAGSMDFPHNRRKSGVF